MSTSNVECPEYTAGSGRCQNKPFLSLRVWPRQSQLSVSAPNQAVSTRLVDKELGKYSVVPPRCNFVNPCIAELTASLHPGLNRSCRSIITHRTSLIQSQDSNTSFSEPSMSIFNRSTEPPNISFRSVRIVMARTLTPGPS